MNIFFLSDSQSECARYHCDKHVVKMPLELAQMLSTAHHINDSPFKDKLFKPTHINHQMAKWVRENPDNYLWAYKLFCYLLDEFDLRFDKTKHQRIKQIKHLLCVVPIRLRSSRSSGRLFYTYPPLCMPDKYKEDSIIQSYRNYYAGDKARIATWKSPGDIPDWFLENKFYDGNK